MEQLREGREELKIAQSQPRDGVLLAALFAILANCTAVPQESGKTPVQDSGTDSTTEGSTDMPALFVQEDALPGWRLIWANQYGSAGKDIGGSLARCGPDAFAVTGWFEGEVSFGGFEMNGWAGHMYLAKLTLGGQVLWATWAGHGYTVGTDVAFSPESGRIAVVGTFGSDAVFGSGEQNETWLHEEANGDAGFLAVYEQDGTLSWARELAPVGELLSGARAQGLAFLPDGSVLVTGWFVGEMTIGLGMALSSPDEMTAFVVRYNPEGEIAWAKSVGGPGRTHGGSLAPLSSESFVLFGTYYQAVVFGEAAIEATGDESAFLARMDGAGEIAWAIDLGIDGSSGSSTDIAGDIEILENGELAITGTFSEGSMLAGDGESLSPVQAPDQGLFLARYTTEGANVWTRVVPVGSPHNSLVGVTEIDDGTLVASGSFSGTAEFSHCEEDCQLQAFHGSFRDCLVAAWSPEGDFLWSLRQGGEEGDDSCRSILAFTDEKDGHDILIVAGYFEQEAIFGTGGGDTVALEAAGDWVLSNEDIVLLRFDRDAE